MLCSGLGGSSIVGEPFVQELIEGFWSGVQTIKECDELKEPG
jgi:hypothetical protein